MEPEGSEVRMMEGFTRSLPSSPLLHLRLAKRTGTGTSVCLSVCLSLGVSRGDSLLEAKHRKHTFTQLKQDTHSLHRRRTRWPSPANSNKANISKTNIAASHHTYVYLFYLLTSPLAVADSTAHLPGFPPGHRTYRPIRPSKAVSEAT